MTPKSLLFTISSIALISIVLVTGPGCANIVPPAGGPRDSIPPQLLKAEPGDSALAFKGNRISFTFDDYVEIQNQQQELLVSPTPKIEPEVNYRLNVVTVRLRDTLEANTTYTINFGNAIKDINEGNVLKGFTYTFSTGSYLDSLQLSGNVILAETGKTDSTLIVMLHTSGDDSALVKSKPRYVAKLDSRGHFTFRNLPPRTYYLYALKDEGSSRLYFGDKQLFAFADSPVVISDSARPVTLYAYSKPQPAAPAAPVLSVTPGGRSRGGAGTADRRLRFTTSLADGQQDLLSRFKIVFDNPLKIFDSTLLGLFTDSAFNPAPDWRFFRDSTNRIVHLEHTWKENTVYHLVMNKDFAEDSTGKKLLRTDTLSFRTKKLSDYGEIRIRVRDLDLAKKPVLLFYLNNNLVQSFPLNSQDFSRTVFLPGDYELRILFDENGNGKWDPGEFFGVRKQPELVKPVGRRIIVKPSWVNEFEVSL